MTVLTVPRPKEYIVGENGKRIGVVLDWEVYKKLQASIPADPDLLLSLDNSELQLLAEGMLSSPNQSRLETLLKKNKSTKLTGKEEKELGSLIAYIDSMNLLKAKAQYTLQQRSQ